jgi:hypothetical protein
MFLQPPPFIPYGGFSPVRLEASLPRQILPRVFGALFDLSFVVSVVANLCPGVSILSRGHHLTVAPLSIHRLRPQALGSSKVVLSLPSWLLRPDPPVSQAPSRLTSWLLETVFVFRPPASPSLLCFDRPSPIADTPTPSGKHALRKRVSIVIVETRATWTLICSA